MLAPLTGNAATAIGPQRPAAAGAGTSAEPAATRQSRGCSGGARDAALEAAVAAAVAEVREQAAAQQQRLCDEMLAALRHMQVPLDVSVSLRLRPKTTAASARSLQRLSARTCSRIPYLPL